MLERARRALDTLEHRGPDQKGEWVDSTVYIGHRRLSILDLSETGRQPMVAGQVILAANGEIYNYRQLKKELEREYQFESASDSEVLLHGYRAWGINGLLERIDGMFAFVIYDVRAARLFIARDRVGIKPIYYSVANDNLVWASELKALREFMNLQSGDIDATSLYDFLTYRYIPAPKTLYRGVCKLEPAHFLEFDVITRRSKLHRYWSLEVQPHDGSAVDAVERVRELVSASVQEQLVSDVPVGCFLSGGIDSTVIVAEASRRRPDMNTFCIAFAEDTHDESSYACLAASKFGTKHRTRLFPAAEMDLLLDQSAEWYDEPFADLSCWPTYLVCSFARQYVTVALSGDGGDELFGGYLRYRRFASLLKRPVWFRNAMRASSELLRQGAIGDQLRARLVQRVELRAVDDLEIYVCLLSGLLKGEKRAYADKWGIPADYDDYWHLRRFYREDLPVITRMQYVDFHTYLPDDILTKVDRASMAVSLEARVPLLSRNLVEYVFSLPERIRFPEGDLKGLLKKAYTGVIPESIIARSKKGFSIPSGKYLQTHLRAREWDHELVLRRARLKDWRPSNA